VVIRLAGWFRQVEQLGREDLFSTPPDRRGRQGGQCSARHAEMRGAAYL
jgi:hypothetical protein